MPPRLPIIIGILAWCLVHITDGRASTRVRLPVPVGDSIPLVAEAMGATSYEESLDEPTPPAAGDSGPPAPGADLQPGSSGEVKRVQRKLTGELNKEEDLDHDQVSEYQGVIGRPGVDFPVLPGIPRTDFNCRKVKSSGYYADLETGCQVFHICDGGRKISFLCPNGTIFRQSHLICDWWFRVDCERSPEQYEESAEQLAQDQMIYKKRAEEIARAMSGKSTTATGKSSSLPAVTPSSTPVYQQKTQARSRQQQVTLSREPESSELERQIPAETASFVSNNHRFNNQLENQFKEYYATSTNSPPSTYQSKPNNVNYNNEQYSENTSQQLLNSNNFESTKQKITGDAEYINDYPNNNNKAKNQNSHSSATNNNNPTFNNSGYKPYYTASHNNSYSSQNNNQQGSNRNYNGNNVNRGNTHYLNSDRYQGDVPQYTNPPSSSTGYSTFSTKSNENFPSSYSPSSLELSTNTDFYSLSSTTARSTDYNDYTPKVDKHAGVKQKPIFNVKIKPTKDTKDIAYLELLRHEEESASSAATNYYPSSSNFPTSPSTVSATPSTLQTSSIVTETTSRNTYLPKSTSRKTVTDANINPVTNRYASINISGTPEEIRPEIVNALMESGVTPTSARALHSLASYISSGVAEQDYTNVYNDGSHPHVSDVVLSFRSGSPINTFTDASTNTPVTSSGEDIPAVLTNATKGSYSYLFSDSKDRVDFRNEVSTKTKAPSSPKSEPTTTPLPQTTLNMLASTEGLKLKDSSQLRELAQVFSRALSAYLEDPETFKEILAQVRPTEPNVDNTTPSVEDEVLDFSDAMLGRLGTTVPPATLAGTGDFDDNLNIGDINSLAGGRNIEPDNSLEPNTFPPTAPEAFQDSQHTSATPQLLYFNQQNNSDDFYSKLGSAEDQSYFPTVGGVGDTSRPRYGGFQNNTGETKKPYSPYGSDLPKNITGVPISTPQVTTPASTPVTTKENNSAVQNLPEPNDVNNLSRNNVLHGDNSNSEESYDLYKTSPPALQDEYYSNDPEKLLIASGSQSLVSSDNYIQFAKKFNEQQKYGKKLQGKDSSSPSQPINAQEDLSPYFGQEPPYEILAEPSGFKTHAPDVTGNNQYKGDYISSDPINYHIGSQNSKSHTSSPQIVSSQSYEVTYGSGSSTGSGSWDPSSSTGPVTWTVAPLFDATSAGTSLHQSQQAPVSTSTHLPSDRHRVTTYHPPHSSEIEDKREETTSPTENIVAYDTTPGYDSLSSQSSLNPDNRFSELAQAAKEMFGSLNESTATALMNMMAQGESNMTIRRLVLLLVNDKNRNNFTIKESRERLIKALLTNNEDLMTTLAVQETTEAAPQPTTHAPRKKVLVSRTRVSPSKYRQGKSYRGTDAQTAVHGANRPSPAELSRINAAKLYIPTASASALTSQDDNKLSLDSDARAVELLKTLYSLAARWG